MSLAENFKTAVLELFPDDVYTRQALEADVDGGEGLGLYLRTLAAGDVSYDLVLEAQSTGDCTKLFERAQRLKSLSDTYETWQALREERGLDLLKHDC